MAIAAGSVCTVNIFLLAVAAPYKPAIATQPKKNKATLVFHSALLISIDHIRPAAKKPLYNPWLPAMALVGGKSSFGKLRNTFGPRLVHANISSHTMYRWIKTTKPMAM